MQLCGNYFIRKNIRIFIKQPVFEWKVSGRDFFVAQLPMSADDVR